MSRSRRPMEPVEISGSELDCEEWRPVAMFPQYEVSSLGRVRSLRNNAGNVRVTPKILRPGPSTGYYAVVFSVRGVRAKQLVHHLVLEAFHGPRPVGMVGRHFPDRRRGNNRASNLQWGTPAQNVADREMHDTTARGARSGMYTHPHRRATRDRSGARRHPECVLRGEAHARSKITRETVVDMRRKYAAREASKAALAREHGLGWSTVHSLIEGHSWFHVKEGLPADADRRHREFLEKRLRPIHQPLECRHG